METILKEIYTLNIISNVGTLPNFFFFFFFGGGGGGDNILTYFCEQKVL